MRLTPDKVSIVLVSALGADGKAASALPETPPDKGNGAPMGLVLGLVGIDKLTGQSRLAFGPGHHARAIDDALFACCETDDALFQGADGSVLGTAVVKMMRSRRSRMRVPSICAER